MNKKKATPKNEAARNNVPRESNASAPPPAHQQPTRHQDNNSAAAQRGRVLVALRSGPKSTLHLRRDCDVLAPAARVLELKQRGHHILTHWVNEPTDCGKLHRVALYVLLQETGGKP
jgi:hypothetical protein